MDPMGGNGRSTGRNQDISVRKKKSVLSERKNKGRALIPISGFPLHIEL